MSQLAKTAGWHEGFGEFLREEFPKIDALFLAAAHKAFWLGMMLNFAKEQGKADGSIPHGQFRPFIARLAPKLAWQRVAEFMHIARNVVEKGKFQMSGFRTFARGGDLPLAALMGDGADLPKELRAFKAGIDAFLEGRTKSQLLTLDVKQVEEGEDGELRTKRGRLKGQGGASAAQRARAKLALEAGEVEAVKLWAEKATRELQEMADDAHLGKALDARETAVLLEAVEGLADYLRRLTRHHKGAQAPKHS